jgi:hypothetical protein
VCFEVFAVFHCSVVITLDAGVKWSLLLWGSLHIFLSLHALPMTSVSEVTDARLLSSPN